MSTNTKIASRQDIIDQYKWDVAAFYPSDDIWEEDYNKLKNIIVNVTDYKGQLSVSLDKFKSFTLLREEIKILMGRLYTYAKMRWDEDTKNNFYKGLFEKAMNLSNELDTVFFFVEPEIIANLDIFIQYADEDSKIHEYQRYFHRLKENKVHILSDQEEAIISEASLLISGPESIFGVLNDSDLELPIIKDDQGQDVQLSHGRFSRFMESYNRDVRRGAFEAMYSTYKKYINTYSSILTAHLKTDIFHARVRKYNNCLEAALKPNEIPLAVYDNVIDSIHDSLPSLQKYLELRKKILGYDNLHMYDLYVPMVTDFEYKISYEEACDILLKAFQPLGDEYVALVKEAFDKRWIDVFENEGKRSGAYSWGSYNTYPYILMNYQNNINSMFTLAHEIGHSIHSYYSKQKQPLATSSYVIFVAEVASTVNETLLFQYLLNNTEDKRFKAYLINYFIEGFRTTVFRQTLFAEFEKKVHEEMEAGSPLTSQELSDIYYELNKNYYAPAVNVDDEIRYEWARIPHFYYNFYVYQYATGFTAAQSLVRQILADSKDGQERYLEFLASGSSSDPISLLKSAGVDMMDKQSISQALESFSEYIDQLDKLLS